MSDRSIFFDHASTTPMDERVLSAMLPYFKEKYGNPSSHIHQKGREALAALDKARRQTADLINAGEEEIIFTSSATESNNLAIKGIGRAYRDKGRHILISEIEHFSVLFSADTLKKEGFIIEKIPVHQNGIVIKEELQKRLRPDTILVSVMLSNTEIGTIQPIKELTKIVKDFNSEIIFHTDGTSSVGWIPVDVKDLQVDALTLSAHNFYGPKGASALFLKEGIKIEPLLDGGFQEGGRRSGIENVPAIVGLGKACELAKAEMDERNKKLIYLQNKLWKGLEEKIQYLHFTGDREKRLPGHVSFWVEFAEGESLLLYLQINGIMASSGSACSSNMLAQDEDQLVASHVLTAVKVPSDICAGSITFFLGKDNTQEEVDYLLSVMPGIVEKLWAISPAYSDMLKQKEIKG